MASAKSRQQAEASKAAPRGEAAGPEGSFEASLERLGAIVEALEGGDLPLERTLSLFEEGVALARAAQARLDAAEQRVEELLSVDADGAPVTRPFEEER